MITIINPIPEDILAEAEQRYGSHDYEGLSLLGSGSSANVFLLHGYAWKVFYDDEDAETGDASILEQLQGISYFPKLFAYRNFDYVIMEYIDGCTFEELFWEQSFLSYLNPDWREDIRTVVALLQVRGFYANDIYGANVIIQTDGSLRFVDVGYYEQRDGEATVNQIIQSLQECVSAASNATPQSCSVAAVG